MLAFSVRLARTLAVRQAYIAQRRRQPGDRIEAVDGIEHVRDLQDPMDIEAGLYVDRLDQGVTRTILVLPGSDTALDWFLNVWGFPPSLVAGRLWHRGMAVRAQWILDTYPEVLDACDHIAGFSVGAALAQILAAHPRCRGRVRAWCFAPPKPLWLLPLTTHAHNVTLYVGSNDPIACGDVQQFLGFRHYGRRIDVPGVGHGITQYAWALERLP